MTCLDSVVPAMLARLRDARSYIPLVQIGEVIAIGLGIVVTAAGEGSVLDLVSGAPGIYGCSILDS